MDNIFNILSDKNRLRIVLLLINRELCMSHIYLALDLKQANTSRNLGILKDAKIIKSRTNKHNRYFSLTDEIEKNHSDIYNYLIKILNKDEYKKDIQDLKDVKNCSCNGQCECKI